MSTKIAILVCLLSLASALGDPTGGCPTGVCAPGGSTAPPIGSISVQAPSHILPESKAPCHCDLPQNTARPANWDPLKGCCEQERQIYPEMKGAKMESLPIIPELKPRESDLPITVDPGRTYKEIHELHDRLAQEEIDHLYKMRAEHAPDLTVVHGTDEEHNAARIDEESIRAKHRELAAREIDEIRQQLDENVDHDLNQIRQQNEGFAHQQAELAKERLEQYSAFERSRTTDRIRQLETRADYEAYNKFGFEPPRTGHQNGVARLRDAILTPDHQEKFEAQQARQDLERQEQYEHFEASRSPELVHADVVDQVTPEEAKGEQVQLSMQSAEGGEQAVAAESSISSSV